MASPIAQFRVWDKAKDLARKFHYDEAITLYRSVETDIKNMQEWRQNKSERDMLFDQALFFSDYCGALCDGGLYAEAREMGDIALKCIEQGKFSTLKYIYYNIGNIYLFQKDYEQALKWYEQAVEKSRLSYLINSGIALYRLKRVNEAKATFETFIEKSKGSKIANSFEPYFYLMKIYQKQGDEKESQKYKKMYLTRLKKYTQIEIEWATSTMEDGKEILADYHL
jgi:tetratricopeptide (TPR) repeat protein